MRGMPISCSCPKTASLNLATSRCEKGYKPIIMGRPTSFTRRRRSIIFRQLLLVALFQPPAEHLFLEVQHIPFRQLHRDRELARDPVHQRVLLRLHHKHFRERRELSLLRALHSFLASRARPFKRLGAQDIADARSERHRLVDRLAFGSGPCGGAGHSQRKNVTVVGAVPHPRALGALQALLRRVCEDGCGV